MPLKIRIHEDQTSGLVPQCDACYKLISDAQMANICWPTLPFEVGALFDFYITCKNPLCNNQLEARLGQRLAWQEFDAGIVFLMNNTQFKLKEAKRRAFLHSQ